MSKLLMEFQIFLTFLFFADFHVEAHPVVAPCLRCVDILNFPDIFHPFEYLACDLPLDLFCTNVTIFLKCIENCFDPRAPPDDIFDDLNGWLLRRIANFANISDHICTNGTELREDYLTNSQCFRNVYIRSNSLCEYHILNSFFNYFDPHRRLLDLNDEIYMERMDCATASAYIGCLGLDIHQECGDNALDTFKDIIKLFGLFKTGFCSTETLQIIRTSFIDSLSIDESKKSFYRECLVRLSTGE